MHNGELRKKQEQREQEAASNEQHRLEDQAKAIEQAIQKLAVSDDSIKKLRDQVIVEVRDTGLSIQVMDQARDPQLLFDLSSAELKPPLVQPAAEDRRRARRAAEPGAGRRPHRQPPVRRRARPRRTGSSRSSAPTTRAACSRSNGLRDKQVTRVLAFADTEPLKPENPLADENRRLSILAERIAHGRHLGVAARRPRPIVLPPDQIPDRTASLATGRSSEVW